MKPSTVRIAGKNWIIIAIGEHIVAQIAGIGVGILVRTDESAGIGIIISGLEVIEAEVIGIVIIAAIAQGVQFGDGFGRIFRLGGSLVIRLDIVRSTFSGDTAGVCCGIYNADNLAIRVIVMYYLNIFYVIKSICNISL